MTFQLYHGDCLEVMAGMDADSVDAIVCDPPYGLEFMGKEWDRLGDIGKISHQGPSERDGSTVFGRQRIGYNGSANKRCRACGHWEYSGTPCQCENPDFPDVKAHQARIMQEWHYRWAVEALRVAKPGAHLLAFGGTRTFHRLACAIEDAGWELRDTLSWLYGSGFPKSHDVSKAIDKAAGAERENGGVSSTACPDFPNPCQGHPSANGSLGGGVMRHSLPTAPATPEAEQWAGYGTALKPAWEPIIMARKPFRGTVAANVLEWGTGAINVDATRVPTDNGEPAYTDRPQGVSSPDWVARGGKFKEDRKGRTSTGSPAGRWPPNLVHDGSDEVTACFPVTGNNWRSDKTSTNGHSVFGVGQPLNVNGHNDTGSASRFFPALPLDAEDVDAARVMYCAKASKRDRDDGCEGLEARVIDERNGYSTLPDLRMDHKQARSTSRNHHPTVKPTALMRWLVRLVTPPGGVVLDPFMGSGSTGKAAIIEGFDFIGIELEAEYIEIARRRIEAAQLPLLATG